MNNLHFEGRDVPPYTDYAAPETLVVGNTYFAVHFVDKGLTIPEMRAFVFIGRNLQEGDSAELYFQDAESYVSGVRYESPTRGGGDAEFHAVDEDTPFVCEFERALDQLLYCSLTRSRN